MHEQANEDFDGDCAVINPATGETLRTYPTISDEQLRERIADADTTQVVLRVSQPGDRQHDPAQARTSMPRVCRGARAALPRRGLPRDAYINTYATNEQVETVIADPRVRGVSLTGSERAGSAVAEIAGRHLKKVVLELGGSDPAILLGTDDRDTVVKAVVRARLQNTGQACNAGKRFIVVDDLYEPFLEKFTAALTSVTPADPMSDVARIGPLSSSTAADRLDDRPLDGRAALRRRQTVRVRTRARTLRARGVRQQEAHSRRRLTPVAARSERSLEERRVQ